MGSSVKTDKKERKEKKRSESSGVHKKKDSSKRAKNDTDRLAAAVADHLEAKKATPTTVVVPVVNEADAVPSTTVVPASAVAKGSLLPIAKPLADEKATKKILKTIRKGEFVVELTR